VFYFVVVCVLLCGGALWRFVMALCLAFPAQKKRKWERNHAEIVLSEPIASLENKLKLLKLFKE